LGRQADDDDAQPGLGFDAPVRVGYLLERINPVDDGANFIGLEQLLTHILDKATRKRVEVAFILFTCDGWSGHDASCAMAEKS